MTIWMRMGAPTLAAVARLAAWPREDTAGAIAFMRDLWWGTDWGVTDTFTDAERDVYQLDPSRRYVKFVTGGWSDNESLMETFLVSSAGQSCLLATQRGGVLCAGIPRLNTGHDPSTSRGRGCHRTRAHHRHTL